MSPYWPARFPTRRLIVLLYSDRDRSSAAYRNDHSSPAPGAYCCESSAYLQTFRSRLGGKCPQRCHPKMFLQVLEFH